MTKVLTRDCLSLVKGLRVPLVRPLKGEQRICDRMNSFDTFPYGFDGPQYLEYFCARENVMHTKR